jgi:integrase
MVSKSKRKIGYRTFGSVKLLESGKYQASYKRTIGGKPKTFYGPRAFATKTEANNWLTAEANLLLTKRWTDPSEPSPLNTVTPPFGDYALRHISLQTNSSGKNLKPSTVEKYEAYRTKYLSRFLDIPLDQITKAMVDEWWASAVANGKLTTASKAYKFLHSVMARALADGWIRGGVSPCQVKGAQNASTGQPTYTPTMDEVSLVAQKIDPRFRVMVLVSAYAALRFSEASALRRSHFRLIDSEGIQRYEITIQEAVTYVGGKFILGEPKNKKGIGKVLVTSSLTPFISKHLDGMNDQSQEALVFPDPNGGYLHNFRLAKAMKLACKRAGLSEKAITPHSLRRAGGTEYGNCGANLTEVKDFIRDSSTNAAMRYIQSTNRTVGLAESMSAPFAQGEPA